MPKPDAIILLHAPPHVLQSRKQELTLAETERQCRDYLVLVGQQAAGHVVDAAQPFSLVMRDVCAIILETREGAVGG
jgi:thymidylate kinase